MTSDFPVNLLKELHFEDLYLTDQQEERLYEVLNASMTYERRAFDRFYVYHIPLESIAKEENRSVDQIMKWVATISGNVESKKDYILTGAY